MGDSNGPKKRLTQRYNEFSRNVWNRETKQFIGRTASSWAKIGLFYLVFYACLAAFFAIMLAGFFATLKDDEPTQQGMFSLIKSNPGMGFRPQVDVESTLIKFRTGVPDSYQKHMESIDSILSEYYEFNQTDAIHCDASHRQTKDDKTVCGFNIEEQFGHDCSKENDYGFKEGKPCVLLKVNKVFGWQPEPFDNQSLADSDDEKAQEAKAALGSRMNPNYIGISCEGENEGDADNIYKTSYYPNLGFSYAYYPYYNHKGYLAPLVFVQMEVKRGVLIQVWCKMWTKNIKHHKNDRAGSSHFELLVD